MKQKRFRKLAGLISLICLVLFALVPAALAFEGRGGDTVVIGADEVIEDDLYVGAGTFILDGTIKGDLIVGGNTIEINGTVEGDLLAAGQTVVVRGTVTDDVRIAGQVLTLDSEAQVGDDVMAAGMSIEGKKGSSVGGSFFYAGYQALLAGDVAENLAVAVGGLQLSGSVGGDVKAEVGEVEEGPSPMFFMPGVPSMPSVPLGLTVDEGAHIGGKLDYTSASEWSIPAGVVAGTIRRHEPEVKVEVEVEEEVVVSPTRRAANWFLRHLRRLVTLLLVGLLMVWVVPSWTEKATGALQAKPLPSLGWGVVTIAAFIFALLVILTVTIIGAVVLGVITLGGLAGTTAWTGALTMALLAFCFSIAVAYVTKVVVSFLGGRLILAGLKPDWAEGRIWPLVVGVVLFIIITTIPRLGGLVNLVVVLLGLGALWLLGRDIYRQGRAAPVEAEA
ncbi:MAG: polymer-forming cytoskeletal protein [Anaerolineales bacterium]|nr:MAG: polymer-forming cytoskeletal protein [Anaerolineales bacterium]